MAKARGAGRHDRREHQPGEVEVGRQPGGDPAAVVARLEQARTQQHDDQALCAAGTSAERRLS
jgi:hypothetical protein